MKVQILKEGPYSAFHNLGGFTKASMTWREVGEVVEHPAWYAESLAESGLAVLVTEVEVPEVVDMSTAEVVRPRQERRGLDGFPGIKADEVKRRIAELQESDIDATAAARNLAHSLGVDLKNLENLGSGKDGRITTADVRKAAGGE